MSKKPDEEHKELMHYTSASGLHGIVTSKTLWASHASFVNDNEEVVGFFGRVLPIILKSVFERCVAESDNLKKLLQSAHQKGVNQLDCWLREIVDAFKQAQVMAEDHYIAFFARPRTHGFPSMAS